MQCQSPHELNRIGLHAQHPKSHLAHQCQRIDELAFGMHRIAAQIFFGQHQGLLQGGLIELVHIGTRARTCLGVEGQPCGLAGAALEPALAAVHPSIQTFRQLFQRAQLLQHRIALARGCVGALKFGAHDGAHTRNFRCRNWRKPLSH